MITAKIIKEKKKKQLLGMIRFEIVKKRIKKDKQK